MPATALILSVIALVALAIYNQRIALVFFALIAIGVVYYLLFVRAKLAGLRT